jgi:hypothetical protein
VLELLTSGGTKPRSPIFIFLCGICSRSGAEAETGEEKTYGLDFHRDSIGSPKRYLSSKRGLERSCERARSCRCRWLAACVKWYQSPFLVCTFQAREARAKEHSDTHQVVSEQELCLYISSRGEKVEEDRALETL